MERYPLNAPGPFYVADGHCISCKAPEAVAPSLMGYFRGPEGSGTSSCYFKKQPSSPEETAMAIDALRVQCCDALRYEGQDPDLIEQLPPRQCDRRRDDQQP